jgi:hypothetical protein
VSEEQESQKARNDTKKKGKNEGKKKKQRDKEEVSFSNSFSIPWTCRLSVILWWYQTASRAQTVSWRPGCASVHALSTKNSRWTWKERVDSQVAILACSVNLP